MLFGAIALLCAANIFNLGADISAIWATAQLILGGNLKVYAVLFGLISIFLQIYVPTLVMCAISNG